ncbi:MAG: PEP-CTERM sorting domain-containing protein [Acidobacteria bacterium]|nr:PEP-CTERM sorting domain-containing protein [Acidobacteriota bacterium]
MATLMMVTAAYSLASPITYIYSGTGSGSIGGSSFADEAFTITATADTSNISPWCCSPLQNTHLSTTIKIGKAAVFTILTPSHTWLQEGFALGLGENLSNNWLSLPAAALVNVGYGLATAIGPVTYVSPWDVYQFNGISTSGGALTFTSISTATFEAVVPGAVPEPSSMLLLATGMLGLAVGRRVYLLKP